MVPKAGLEPARPMKDTRPSTWRVCQNSTTSALMSKTRNQEALPGFRWRGLLVVPFVSRFLDAPLRAER